MSHYDSTLEQPKAREVIEWAVGVLRADGALHQLLELEGEVVPGEVVMAHEQQAGADGLPDRFLVVRELVESGGRLQTFSGVDSIPLQVMAECDPRQPAHVQWHEEVHARIYELLVGERPQVETGSALTPVRQTRRPARPLWVQDDQRYASTATYRTTIEP